KGDNQGFGTVSVVSPKFSSISEQVADFLTLLEPQITIDVDSAQNLLSGIIYSTNDFQDPKTSYLALEMAGILMRKGAVRTPRKQVRELDSRQNANMFFPPRQQPKREEKPQGQGVQMPQGQQGRQQQNR